MVFTLSVLVPLALFSGSGCDLFDKVVPPAEEPERDNPRDPDPKATNRQEPETTIISGPTSNEIVTERTVQFSWEGNLSDMGFQYHRDGENWSDWDPLMSVVLGPLSEGSHTFEVRGGYSRTDYDDTPAIAVFTVNAVEGPALCISPPDTSVIRNETIEIWLMAEEVTDLMAVSSVIRYDPGMISVITLQPGPFLESNGGNLFHLPPPHYDSGTGTIEINMAVGEGNPPGVSGSGILLVIRFRAGGTPGETELSIISASLRDDLNNPIAPQQLLSAKITVR